MCRRLHGDDTMSIFEDKWNIDGVEYESTLADDLRLDRMNLNEEFEKHAEKFAFYSTAYEICLDKERRAKAVLDRVYAILDSQARGDLAANGIKATEKKIENMVVTAPDYLAAQDEYFEAQRLVGLLKSARDAMIHKKECMVSLGANFRQEMNSDPSLLQQVYKQRFGNNE